MQQLLVLQSLWAMQNLRNAPSERDLEANVAAIKGAGFNGFGTMWEDEATARQTAELARAEGLVLEGLCLPTAIEQNIPALEWGTRYGLHHMNLQLNMRPRTQREAEAILDRLDTLAAQVAFPIYVETHRGRMTNDLLFTLDLLDARPNLRLLADLSHYVVAREVELPVSTEIDQQITQILDRAWAFHGRVAASGQVQVPLTYPQHQPWIDQFATWWARGFDSWCQRAGADDMLTFVCELGPQPYAISGADGRDLTDRWEESKLMQQMVRQIWQG